MSAPTGLTVLLCDERHTASKSYTPNADGTWTKTNDYNAGFAFGAMERECPDLPSLARLIEDIRKDGNAIIVRGGLDDAGRVACESADANNRVHKIARRKNEQGDGIPAHLTEVPRQWIMNDIDGWQLPPGADLATDPTAVIDAAIRALYPEPFHDAECFWQLSASAGLVPGVLKLHPFFWLSKPYDNAYLRRWFKHYAPLVDTAPFSAVQPHYITDPVISGGIDPLPVRTGWRHGTSAEVVLPPLPDVTDYYPHVAGDSQGTLVGPTGFHTASIADALARLGDGDGLDGFHHPLLIASMKYAIRCERGGARNDRQFITKVQAAIDAAPKREGRDIAVYLGESYLRRIINGAFHLILNNAKSETIEQPGAAGPMKLPAGFGMTGGGLFFCNSKADDANPEWVCQQFAVTGDCADGTGGNWGVVMTWRDELGNRHTWIMPRELLHGEPHVIAAQLESQGLRCNFGRAAQANLRRCLAAVRPGRRLRAVTTGGWHGMNFVLPDGTVYGNADVILRPELQHADMSCAESGTLADWQDQVAKYAVGNSRLASFISAAFAGSLLDIISESSGGLHLHGKSQTGKSTAVFAAASVWGKGSPRDGAVHQWRTTSNGLEGIAARCSDGCLVLDEISQSDARDAGDSIYQLANGQGKQRADRSGGARHRASWRIMFLSTGEVTLAQKMTEAGKRTMTGLEVRLVNIDGDAGAGLGVFETLHGFDEPALLSDHLRHAAAISYGTAGRAFLSKLVATRAKDSDGFYELVKGLRQQFISEYLPAGSDGQVRSVAGRLGVIALAGELATEWGILPWQTGEATNAAAICFRAWLNQRGGIGAGEDQAAIRQVRQFFEAHGTSRFVEIKQYETSIGGKPITPVNEELHDWKTINRCGWRRYDKASDQWNYFVLPEAWKSDVCRGIDGEVAAKALADRGWLKREGRNLTCKVTIPEHGRPRVYVVSGALLEGDAD